MSQRPPGKCPECGSEENQPIHASYVYEPEDDDSSDQVLLSTTYTLQCTKCGHIYMICEPGE